MLSLRIFLTLSVAAFLPLSFAQAAIPAPKGTFNYNLSKEPTTLNPITSTDAYASTVQAYVMDTLMTRNENTYDWQPALAEKAETSKDGTTFTFTIREGVKFHDGKPVTVEDVKFSFDVIFDPEYNLAHIRPYYENIEKAEVVDPRTIRFTAKNRYFGNFNVVAGLTVVPKHVYGDAMKGNRLNRTIVGSGPYKLERYERGRRIILVRNNDWWGNKVESEQKKYRFQRISMRFAGEENVALEMLKKGDLDFESLTPDAFVTKTTGSEWTTRLTKQQVENKAPKGYGYVGWNMRKDLFKDRNVRIALAHLMNRQVMNDMFRHGMSLLARGPWYQQSEYADPAVKAIEFDPKKAAELLKKAGWADTDKDGILDKMIDGRRVQFAFTLMHSNKDMEKYWTLYQQDLRRAGIKMDIRLLEWNAFIKFLDEGNFDAVALAWSGGSVDLDPKQIWHSSSAVKGGSNFIGYSNPKVDQLIDRAREETDKKKRIPMLREVYRTIAADAPYAFLFNDRYALYAHTNRMQMEKPTYNYTVGTMFWWIQQ
jgi:microcin C transport system substrate-binding protein